MGYLAREKKPRIDEAAANQVRWMFSLLPNTAACFAYNEAGSKSRISPVCALAGPNLATNLPVMLLKTPCSGQE
jgi:hypothetical protein